MGIPDDVKLSGCTFELVGRVEEDEVKKDKLVRSKQHSGEGSTFPSTVVRVPQSDHIPVLMTPIT